MNLQILLRSLVLTGLLAATAALSPTSNAMPERLPIGQLVKALP